MSSLAQKLMKVKTRLFFLALILLAGCVQSNAEYIDENSQNVVATNKDPAQLPNPQVKLNMQTDSGVYQSRQPINITVTVITDYYLEDAQLQITGFTSNYGRDLLLLGNNLNITEGTHSYNYSYTTPTCSPCAGLSEGGHSIQATLTWRQMQLANTTKMVELKK